MKKLGWFLGVVGVLAVAAVAQPRLLGLDFGPPPPRPHDSGFRNADRNDRLNQQDLPSGEVQIVGGFDTDFRDHGRPVALIAAALGVEDQVFLDAFRNVNPARGGHPTAARARANKQVLMDALSPHGITNERLDEVSNYYRYDRAAGEHWRHRPAKLDAVVEDGRLVAVEIIDAGAGFSSIPTVLVGGYPDAKFEIEIAFDTNFQRNGRIERVTLVE